MRPAADTLDAPRVRRSLLRDARVNWQFHLLLPINLLGLSCWVQDVPM